MNDLCMWFFLNPTGFARLSRYCAGTDNETDWENGQPINSPNCSPSHEQALILDTINDTLLYLPGGACGLLRGPSQQLTQTDADTHSQNSSELLGKNRKKKGIGTPQ